MKIYLAGDLSGPRRAALMQDSKRIQRRLYSYFYNREDGNKPDEDILDGVRLGLDLFLDSGAFSAFTKNVNIAPELYAQFIKDTQHFWTTCSSLDFIGKGEAAAVQSYENLKNLERLGAKVQPVFHVREPDDWLRKYIDEGYDYIFIGGMVPESTDWLCERLDGLWENVLVDKKTRKARVKIHGFGLTDVKLMLRYPWHSVDSSSWLAIGMFGSCVFRTGYGSTLRLRRILFSKEHTDARRRNAWYYPSLAENERNQIDAMLVEHGVTAAQCAEHYVFRDMVNSTVFQKMEELATDTFVGSQETFFT